MHVFSRMISCMSTVAVVVLLGIIDSAAHPASGQAAVGSRAASNPPLLLAEQAFKNVQALKGISAADFMGTMGIMTAALGFDCSECHVAARTDKVDWAADTPRKVIARRMVNMVRPST